jgi:hypothetical protein
MTEGSLVVLMPAKCMYICVYAQVPKTVVTVNTYDMHTGTVHGLPMTRFQIDIHKIRGRGDNPPLVQ